MLTAEARERMEHTLGTSEHRSVTLRRDDLRETLQALDESVEATDKAYGWGVDAGARIAAGPASKPWIQTAGEWFGIFLLLLFVAYLGWMGGAGRL